MALSKCTVIVRFLCCVRALNGYPFWSGSDFLCSKRNERIQNVICIMILYSIWIEYIYIFIFIIGHVDRWGIMPARNRTYILDDAEYIFNAIVLFVMNGEKKCEWMDYCIRFEKIVCWCWIVPTDEYLAIANTDEQYPISIHIHTAVSVLSSSIYAHKKLRRYLYYVYLYIKQIYFSKIVWLQRNSLDCKSYWHTKHNHSTFYIIRYCMRNQI